MRFKDLNGGYFGVTNWFTPGIQKGKCRRGSVDDMYLVKASDQSGGRAGICVMGEYCFG